MLGPHYLCGRERHHPPLVPPGYCNTAQKYSLSTLMQHTALLLTEMFFEICQNSLSRVYEAWRSAFMVQNGNVKRIISWYTRPFEARRKGRC